MGDKSPKNIHKQEEQKHEKVVEKVQHKQENAEAQHHPVSGHPETLAEAAALAEEAVVADADAAAAEAKASE